MTKKNIVFFIHRKNIIKTLGGIIDELIKKNHNVTALLYISKDLDEKCEFNFKNSKPSFSKIYNLNDLSKKVLSLNADIFVQHMGINLNDKKTNNILLKEHLNMSSNNIVRVAVMSHFFDHCLLDDLDNFNVFDMCFVFSEAAAEIHKKILLDTSDLKGDSKIEYKNRITSLYKEKIFITGSALCDLFVENFNKNINNNKVKKKILFLSPKKNHPFLKNVVSIESKIISIVISLLFNRGIYLFDILRAKSLSYFFKQLSNFCKIYKIDLIIKSRPKHKDGFYSNMYKKLSSEYIDGSNDIYYPSNTTANLIKKSNIVIGFHTATVFESVLSGVPFINIEVPLKVNSSIWNKKNFKIFSKYVRNTKLETTNNYKKVSDDNYRGCVWNFRGCVWNYKWHEINNIFKNNFLNNIRIDLKQRKKYIRYYCGITDVPSSLKQANLIEKAAHIDCTNSLKSITNVINKKNDISVN